MSYFLEYITHSIREHSDPGIQITGLHRVSVSSEGDHDEDDDDDSALIEHVPLHSTKEDYGTVSNRNGLTDGYVDWSHSHESIGNAFAAFLAYVVVAIVGYSFVFENWSILDSTYFAVTVFTTVGYGDLAPSTDASRLFTIVFASFGIIILGVFLGIIGARLYELREERVHVKLQGVQHRVMTQFGTEHHVNETGAVEVVVMDNAAMQKEARQEEEMKKKEEKKGSFARDVWEIIKIESPLILVLFMLSSPVVYLEGWDFVMGIYWMFITGTTIGFGDLSPTNTWSKVISNIYLPLAAAVFGEMLAQIAAAYIERCSDEIEDAFLDRALEKGDLEKMDLDNNEIVKPYEFLSYMLVTLGKVGVSCDDA